jgi:2-methylisocitrate lyase-like PEP mutase family enzyme
MIAHLSPGARLRQQLSENIVVAPGAYDGLSARLVAAAGFPAVYASGGAIARAAGYPDIGLLSFTEVMDRVEKIVDASGLPVVADADTGFGGSANVERTVRMMERAGVAAFHIEDQSFPKRCGHLDDKSLVDAGEMARKVHIARQTLADADTLVIARTDAIAVEGFERAAERAALYREAGADMLFVEAPKTRDDLGRIVAAVGRDLPLMANMVEGGKTPPLSGAELEALGFALVIFPGGIVRALARTSSDYYGSLATHGTTEPFRVRMLDFDGLNALIGTPEMVALGKRYEASAAPAGNKTGVSR